MHHCGWGLKPASIIIVLWYCHYSIFPPLWLPPLSPRLRKECKKLFPFKREGETDIFSQGVELEDRLTSTEGYDLTTVMIIMKSNLVQNVISGNSNFPLSLIFLKMLDLGFSSHLTLDLQSFSAPTGKLPCWHQHYWQAIIFEIPDILVVHVKEKRAAFSFCTKSALHWHRRGLQ